MVQASSFLITFALMTVMTQALPLERRGGDGEDHHKKGDGKDDVDAANDQSKLPSQIEDPLAMAAALGQQITGGTDATGGGAGGNTGTTPANCQGMAAGSQQGPGGTDATGGGPGAGAGFGAI